MDSSLRKLTLAFPKAVESSILDALDSLDPPLTGYSFVNGKGRGGNMQLSNVSERVHGAANVILLYIVLPQTDVDAVLEAIRASCSRPNISYWTEPVLEFGRLQ